VRPETGHAAGVIADSPAIAGSPAIAVYPRDAAAEILARIPVPAAPVELPDEAALATLLETAFFATLTDDEGRPTLFRILFGPTLQGDGAPAVEAAITPRPFTVDAVRRLAPAAENTDAALAVCVEGDRLVLRGLILPTPSDTGPLPGPGLQIAGRGRGTVEVSVGGQRIASYVRGNLRLYEQHIHEAGLLRVVERMAPRVAGVAPHVELRTILRLVDAMAGLDHGGTLLVVPDGPYEEIAGLRPSPRYALQGEGRTFLGAAVETFRAHNGLAAREQRRAAFEEIDFDRWEQDRIADRQARRTLDESVRLVAGLTAVDGAVVMTADLELLAFGAMIDVVPDPAPTKVVSVDPFSPVDRRLVPPQSFGGARHQSAIAFCRQQRDGALAFVASQDGTLTFFLRSPDDVIALRPLDLSAVR
jgi:hypothetical protein